MFFLKIICSYCQQSGNVPCPKTRHFDHNKSWCCRCFKDHQVCMFIASKGSGAEVIYKANGAVFIVRSNTYILSDVGGGKTLSLRIDNPLYSTPAPPPPPASSEFGNPLYQLDEGCLCLSWWPEREQWRRMSIVVFGPLLSRISLLRVSHVSRNNLRQRRLNGGSDTEELLLCPKRTPRQKPAPGPQGRELLTRIIIPLILSWWFG